MGGYTYSCLHVYHVLNDRLINHINRMLSVMTFNVGVFVIVLFGVLVGELLLGRFSQGTSWQEGACHGG